MNRHSFSKRIIRLLLMIGVILFLTRYVITLRPAFVEKLSSYAVYPLLLVNRKIIQPIKYFLVHRSLVNELEESLVRCKQERDDLVRDLVDIKGCGDFSLAAEEVVSFRKRYETDQALLAQILFKHFDDDQHFYYIDVGSDRGAAVDMVAVYKNCLLGRVVQVYPWYSKVRLITDPLSKIAALCSNTGTKGIVEGLAKTAVLRLSFASHLDKVQQGDFIVSTGEGLVFPRGFGLGRVAAFERQGLLYNVAVEPLVDLTVLDYCYLVQKGAAIQN